MTVMSARPFLDDSIVNYLKFQIESGNPDRIKRALQELVEFRRRGRVPRPQLLNGLQVVIIGVLFHNKNSKVIRWALNALANFGVEESCSGAIMHALEVNAHDPDIVAAGLAAIFKICHDPIKRLRGANFDQSMIILSALQHVPAGRLDLSCLPLILSKAPEHLLKLGLILTGLNKAPNHMFEPRHTNESLVGVLASHPNSIISQYSIWAAVENPGLGLGDMPISVNDLAILKPNIQKWMLQLICKKPADSYKFIEQIKFGSADSNVEVRLGLSVGLRRAYDPTIEEIVIEWIVREADSEVASSLNEHIVRHAHLAPRYLPFAAEAYQSAPFGSLERQRMLVFASGSSTFGELTKIDYERGTDLFGGFPAMPTININVSNSQIGALSGSGAVRNEGNINITYNEETTKKIREELAELLAAVIKSEISLETKRQIEDAIKQAQTDLHKGTVAKLVDGLKRALATGKDVLSAGGSIASISMAIAEFSGYL